MSTRQLYRDIATLRAGGVLIDGTAGYGYTLTEDPALPPQSFSRLEIEALRVRAQVALGDRFDIRAFHDTVLACGALPLDVLGDVVDAWIASADED